MADRNDDALLDEIFDDGECPTRFRGECDEPDVAIGGFMEHMEFADSRGPYVFQRVGPAGAIDG